MFNRKRNVINSTNKILEERYLRNKFLFEEETSPKTKLVVTPIEDKGPVKKWKISLFKEKDSGNLEDIMTPEIIDELGLKHEYVNSEDAQLDLEKVQSNKLEDLI